MVTPDFGKRRQAALLVLLILPLAVLVFGILNEGIITPSLERHEPPSARRELQSLQYTDDGNPHFWRYAYVIVTYHKAGHALSQILARNMQDLLSELGGGLPRRSASPRVNFDPLTKCSELSLEPGTVTIVEAPQFHCHHEQLADMLVDNPSSDPADQKLGVKIVHLVRNPFAMAVSNYHYHSQDLTPEPFVHSQDYDPCHALTERTVGDGEDVTADLVAPVLSAPHRHFFSKRKMPIMERGDFDGIVNDCRSLYRTRPGLTGATYYEHLLALDPREGLRLSTADKFLHTSLMANDLLLFNRVKRTVNERTAKRPWLHQDLDLITMPLDNWIDHPGESMYRFLDFVFRDHLSRERKDGISSRYEKSFRSKMTVSDHITAGKHADTQELMEYLRDDPVFGRPMRRIEALLEEVLHGESVAASR